MPLTVSVDVPMAPADLPRTGAGIELLVALALLLVVVGAAAVLVAWKAAR